MKRNVSRTSGYRGVDEIIVSSNPIRTLLACVRAGDGSSRVTLIKLDEGREGLTKRRKPLFVELSLWTSLDGTTGTPVYFLCFFMRLKPRNELRELVKSPIFTTARKGVQSLRTYVSPWTLAFHLRPIPATLSDPLPSFRSEATPFPLHFRTGNQLRLVFPGS